MVQALDHIPAAVTISEEDDPNMYRSALRREMIVRVSVYQESAENKREKSSWFTITYFQQKAFKFDVILTVHRR